MKFTIGADPEFFAQDKEGKLRSIIGLLHGSKDNPVAIDDHADFKMLEDNVAAEYNIPPAEDKNVFIQNIKYPQQAIAAILKTKNFEISTKASASFPSEELQDKMAWIFGCEPDFNAWEMCENPKPLCPDINFRSCGGHVHVGYDHKENIEDITNRVKAMDAWLGVWSVIVDPDNDRRQLYGKAGAFRPKDYGFEYRVLSNFWIFKDELISEVFDRTKAALDESRDFLFKEKDRIINIINTGNKADARAFGKTYGIL